MIFHPGATESKGAGLVVDDPHLISRTEPLSEAGRLNGVQWRGSVGWKGKGAYRTSNDGRWSEWDDFTWSGEGGFHLMKKNDKWLFLRNGDTWIPFDEERLSRRGPTCAMFGK